MKRPPALHLEQLEDRTTPSTLSISFVPDGTQVGTQQSHLFQDLNGVSPAVWQSVLLNDLQTWVSQPNTTFTMSMDDGASLNAAAPQDGAIRVAAVDQVFTSDGSPLPADSGGYLVISDQGGEVTFGAGLGLIGPNGNPVSPSSTPLAPPAPGAPSTPLLPLILPLTKAFGGLYPTNPNPPPPPINPTPINPTPPPPGMTTPSDPTPPVVPPPPPTMPMILTPPLSPTPVDPFVYPTMP